MAEQINLQEYDRIIAHFDGNNNDLDDISALPVASLILEKAGVAEKSTFFYNNNIGEPGDSSRIQRMRQSAGFAESLGIQTYDYEADTPGTTQQLAGIIDSGEKILALEGGPMEGIYRALEQASPENRGNVTLVSHSSWNEERDIASRSGVNDVRTWNDVKQSFPEVKTVEIQDQNGSNMNEGFYNSGWNWLDSTDDPILQEARSAMNNAGYPKANDPSDAGMAFFAATGEEVGNPEDVKAFLNDDNAPVSPPSDDPDNMDEAMPETDDEETSTVDEPENSDNQIFRAQNGQVVRELQKFKASKKNSRGG